MRDVRGVRYPPGGETLESFVCQHAPRCVENATARLLTFGGIPSRCSVMAQDTSWRRRDVLFDDYRTID
jgi:hypothetical protein